MNSSHQSVFDETQTDFFSSEIFLETLGRIYYRQSEFEIKDYSINDYCVRLLTIEGAPIIEGPFYDYILPLPQASPGARPISYVPTLVTKNITLDEHEPETSLPPGHLDFAPLIKWAQFSSWEDYLTFIKGRSKSILSVQQKRTRKLIAEHGELTYIDDNPDRQALMQCIEWKIKQYPGGHETLEDPRAVNMLLELFGQGILSISTLGNEHQYLAIHLGIRWGKKYLGLVPAYDINFASYGVGKELNHRALEACFIRGDEEFDMLYGGESYKLDYATHAKLIYPQGMPTLSVRAKKYAQSAVKSTLLRIHPPVYYGVKKAIIKRRQRKLDSA